MVRPCSLSRRITSSIHSLHRNLTGSPLGKRATVSKELTNCCPISTSSALTYGPASAVDRDGTREDEGASERHTTTAKTTAAAVAVAGTSQRSSARHSGARLVAGRRAGRRLGRAASSRCVSSAGGGAGRMRRSSSSPKSCSWPFTRKWFWPPCATPPARSGNAKRRYWPESQAPGRFARRLARPKSSV